jgi:hypothetical protein
VAEVARGIVDRLVANGITDDLRARVASGWSAWSGSSAP